MDLTRLLVERGAPLDQVTSAGKSQGKNNNKIILERKATCHRHGMPPKTPLLGKVWSLASDTVINPVVQRREKRIGWSGPPLGKMETLQEGVR